MRGQLPSKYYWATEWKTLDGLPFELRLRYIEQDKKKQKSIASRLQRAVYDPVWNARTLFDELKTPQNLRPLFSPLPTPVLSAIANLSRRVFIITNLIRERSDVAKTKRFVLAWGKTLPF